MEEIMNNTIFRVCRLFAVVLISLCTLASALAESSSVKIIKRVMLGSTSEDLEFISKGALANHLVVLDGFEVLGIPNGGLAASSVKTLFDLKALNLNVNPRGLAYIESSDDFVVNSLDNFGNLHYIDRKGNSKGTVTISYLNDYFPRHVEGLAYIPSTSLFYPGHMAMVTWDRYAYGEPDKSRIQIIQADGQVVAEIIPPAALDGTLLLGIVYLPSNRLLVSSLRSLDEYGTWGDFYIFDLNGTMLSGPVRGPGTTYLEGLAVIKNGTVACAGSEGLIRYIDQDLNQLPQLDRSYQPSLSLRILRGLAWNSVENKYFLTHWETNVYDTPAFWEAVALMPSLESAAPVVNLDASGLSRIRRLTYIPGERLYAASYRNSYSFPLNPIQPRSIVLLSEDGVKVDEIDLEPLNLGRPEALAYIPNANQFAVSFLDGNQTKLHILSRTGALVRSIDLSAAGITSIVAVEYFNPTHESGGQFLMATTDKKFLVTDFNGAVQKEISYMDDLGILSTVNDIALVTSGPDAGAFAITAERGNNAGSEIILFKIKK